MALTQEQVFEQLNAITERSQDLDFWVKAVNNKLDDRDFRVAMARVLWLRYRNEKARVLHETDQVVHDVVSESTFDAMAE